MQPVLDRPRFRQDLVAEPIDDAGARFIDVMDPDSGNVFRFYEVEYSLACAMDGERDVPGIVQWAKEELGLTPSATEVRTVIATLGDLGYLEAAAAAAAAAPAPAPAVTREPPRQPAPTPVVARPAPGTVPTVKNQWDDAPTTITNADDDLMPGVVVGGRRAATPVADMELGNAGSRGAHAEADLPNTSDLELGTPGTTSRPLRAPDRTQVDDVALGVPGRVDLSVDLSDSVGIGVDDVKEAVRASQVMKAVDVPKELLDSLEAEPDMPAKKSAKQPERPIERPSERPVEAAPQPKPVAKPAPAPKPTESQPKPTAKPVEAPKAPPAPAPTVSTGLIVVLLIVVLGAIAFIVYKFALKKSEDDTQSSTTPTQPHVVKPPAPVKPPEPPPTPAVEVVKLTTGAETTAAVKPMATGQIEMIASDAPVTAGDVIVAFAGHKPIETEIAGLERDIEKRVKPELAQAEKDRDAAQTANNKAAVTAAEARIADRKKSLDDKQGKLAAKKAELEKLVIRAPATGKLTAKAKVGARVSSNDDLADIVIAPVRIAKFAKVPPVTPKARVTLVTKADHKTLSCLVTSSDPGTVTIECPQDAAADGAEVMFGGVDVTPPPAPPAPANPATNDTGDGSAKALTPTPPPAPAPVPRPAPHPAPHPAPPAPDKGSADATPPTPPPPPAPAAAPAGSGDN